MSSLLPALLPAPSLLSLPCDSYNRVNGLHVAENKWLLNDILRAVSTISHTRPMTLVLTQCQEWGWRGLLMSDWTGVYSAAEAIKAGLDLEMPYVCYASLATHSTDGRNIVDQQSYEVVQ